MEDAKINATMLALILDTLSRVTALEKCLIEDLTIVGKDRYTKELVNIREQVAKELQPAS